MLSLVCETYFETDSQMTPILNSHKALGIHGPFCDFLYAFRPDGFLCVFDLKTLGEVPTELRNLLLEKPKWLVYDAESQINALVNTDERLLSLSSVYDVKEILNLAISAQIPLFDRIPTNADLSELARCMFDTDLSLTVSAAADIHFKS